MQLALHTLPEAHDQLRQAITSNNNLYFDRDRDCAGRDVSAGEGVDVSGRRRGFLREMERVWEGVGGQVSQAGEGSAAVKRRVQGAMLCDVSSRR